MRSLELRRSLRESVRRAAGNRILTGMTSMSMCWVSIISHGFQVLPIRELTCSLFTGTILTHILTRDMKWKAKTG